jgi:tRNA dimethylallyltransferase
MHQYLILSGPTGIGKSYFGMRLARHFNCSILSVDSMLVYKDLDIGTAKPSLKEMDEIKHYCVDCVDLDQNYDVSSFLKDATECYQKEKGKIIGIGGTPFYINALEKGLTEIKTNSQYEKYFEQIDTPLLMSWLERLDPERAKNLHINDRFRISRALQIIFSLGKKASQYGLGKQQKINNVKLLCLNAPRDLMHKRIETRIEAMFQNGLLEEAKKIYETQQLSRSAMGAVGYKELFMYFDGQISLDEAKDKILVATRRLLKHQMTWFRKMNVEWIDINFENLDTTFDSLVPYIESHFEKVVKDKGNS